MKANVTVVAMILATGMAMGQTGTAKKPAVPASQSSTAPKTTTTATKPKATKATTAVAKPANKPAAKPAATVEKASSAAGKRDPFVSPVVQRMGAGGEGAPCTTGKRCLVIDQLKVQGVVKTVGGWIAVVGNSANKVYYLRDNDALFDGYVMRIEGDSVVFKQNTLDAMGKQSQREVVKRIAPSA